MSRSVETFESHGFRCVIGAGGPSLQNFNGYLAVEEGHPWHGLHYDDIDCEVHGGLTWSEPRLPWETKPDGEGRHWVGFDTCHAGDLVPAMMTHFPGEVFRDEEYVRRELNDLAEQAARA